MNAPQVGIVLSFLVLPAGMLLLPGIKGTLDALVGLLFSMLAQPFGDQLHLVHDGGSMSPPALGILVPAMASAYLAGEQGARCGGCCVCLLKDSLLGALVGLLFSALAQPFSGTGCMRAAACTHQHSAFQCQPWRAAYLAGEQGLYRLLGVVLLMLKMCHTWCLLVTMG